MKFYNSNQKEVFEELATGETGLKQKEADARLKKYGLNQLKEKKKDPWWKLLLEQFNSPVIWVLLGAVAISIAIGEVVDAIVIAIILIINAVLGFFQEFKAEKAIEALKKMTSLKAVVLRDGKHMKIDATELVPGDVIILETGEKIPADARLIECTGLETQEATLTGESSPVRKIEEVIDGQHIVADQHNMVFTGTIITRGHGKAIVIGTGMKTEIGKIAHMIQETKTEMTPLQKQLDKLGKWLGVATLVICGIVFGTGMIIHQGSWLELFFVAVALAVAAIPEGLPAVVTISLSLGVQRMIKKNALMRHLPSVETLGSTTVICSDKTGTLTHNQMTVRRLFVSGKDIIVRGRGYKPKGEIEGDVSEDMKLLLQIGALNNDAKLDDKKWEVLGDPTEGCLLTSALKAGLDVKKMEHEYGRLDEIPFDSKRKRMCTVHKIASKKYSYVKGAADIIVDLCTHVRKNGKIIKLTDSEKKKIILQNKKYATDTLRVLGFAYKELKGSDKKYEKGLVFVGLQAMMDPPREEVKGAIEKCKTAGIKVIMITGDLKETAVAIARDLGIDGKSLTGRELQQMSDLDLEHVVEDISVYARVNPEHKLKIVAALQKKGHVVAMTGDGVNDAPALKKADIGIAMGITGTDVAKEASEMILTDDNFNSIINAVEEGRGIYDNIRKFVNYLLSCNMGEVLTVFIGSLLCWPLPLLAVHLLWINLVTDGFPAVALGVDPVSKDVMKRPPRRLSAKIMSVGMSLNIFLIGALIAAASLLGYALGSMYSIELARTMAFTVLVVLEIVRIQMVRSSYKVGMWSNKWLLGAVGLSVLLQLVVIYSPLSIFFKTVPLDLTMWGYIGLISVGVYVIGTVSNYLVKKITHEVY